MMLPKALSTENSCHEGVNQLLHTSRFQKYGGRSMALVTFYL